MSPLLVIVIPLALTIIGIMLNSFHIVHDQPAFSFEEDPAHKLAAERQANYHFFQLQRARLFETPKESQSICLVSSGGICRVLMVSVFRCRQSHYDVKANQRNSNIRGSR